MSKPSAAPTIDLTAIPLEATATLLRRVAEALLISLTRREPPPPLARLVGRRELPLLLPYAWGQRSIPARWAMLGPWLRQLWWWLLPLSARPWTPPNLGVGLARNLRRAVDRPASPKTWAELAGFWVDRSVGGATERWLPDPFWPLAGELAWGNETFLAATASVLRESLARRVIFNPGPPPVPLLSPGCFWALIALAETGRSPAWPPLPRGRLTLAGLRRLQLIAGRIALAPAWAGFWDQWVLSEAMRLWPKAAAGVEPALRDALAALPIHQRLGDPPAPADLKTVTLAAPGWERQIPPWHDLLARWDREPGAE